jgi:hypothetical protein
VISEVQQLITVGGVWMKLGETNQCSMIQSAG